MRAETIGRLIDWLIGRKWIGNHLDISSHCSTFQWNIHISFITFRVPPVSLFVLAHWPSYFKKLRRPNRLLQTGNRSLTLPRWNPGCEFRRLKHIKMLSWVDENWSFMWLCSEIILRTLKKKNETGDVCVRICSPHVHWLHMQTFLLRWFIEHKMATVQSHLKD